MATDEDGFVMERRSDSSQEEQAAASDQRQRMQQVINAVLDWHILAVGQRPEDHMARDLLHGSLLRDARPRLFHQNVKAPPDWMKEAVAHLPEIAHSQAIEHLALHFLHRWRLANLTPNTNAVKETLENAPLLGKLWRCWPYGVQVQYNGAQEERTARDVCGLARLCPWCHARKVKALYGKILRGPLKDTKEKWLVRARAIVPSNALGDEAGMIEYLQMPKDTGTSWYVQGENWVLPPNFNHLLHAQHVRFVREQLAEEMIALASAYGVSGGMTTYQVGPHLTDAGLLVFRHELALLGEMTENSASAKRCLMAELRDNEHYLPDSRLVRFDIHNQEKELALFQWLMLPATTKNALRYLLAGTAINYPTHELKLAACSNDLKRLHSYGIDGTLALQPVFMFDDVQWWSYWQQTQGLQLYSPFGSWKGALRDGQEQEPTGHELLGLSRRRRLKGRRVLKQTNAQRSQEVGTRREQLLSIARGIWPGIHLDLVKQVGRPPVRRVLKEKLSLLGRKVSTRDLKWLVKKLQEGERQETRPDEEE